MTGPEENSVFSLPVILSVHFDDDVRDYILARIKTKKGKKRKQQQQKRFSVFPKEYYVRYYILVSIYLTC